MVGALLTRGLGFAPYSLVIDGFSAGGSGQVVFHTGFASTGKLV